MGVVVSWSDRERREKEERSRRARERQQQLMREFARRQQQFLSAMETMEGAEGAAMDWQEEDLERDYDCVICNTTAPTTPADPIGLVVLLQVRHLFTALSISFWIFTAGKRNKIITNGYELPTI